jgi:DNA polymerase III subunit chi
MAEVRFHTLDDASGAGRLRQLCVLTEEAFLAGERVLVWLQDTAAQERFDALLWTFGDRAFVPHETLAADPATSEAPVQLHSGAALDEKVLNAGFTTLVMLRDEATAETLRFAKVIEVVDGDPACRNAGRSRFRFYRDNGCSMQHLTLTS